MRTIVNITIGGDGLLEANRSLQRANRAAFLDRQQQQREVPQVKTAKGLVLPDDGRGIGLHHARPDEPIGPPPFAKLYNTYLLTISSSAYELNTNEDSPQYQEAYYFGWDAYCLIEGNSLGPTDLSELWGRIYYAGSSGGTGYSVIPKVYYFVIDLTKPSTQPLPLSRIYELRSFFYLDVQNRPVDDVPEPQFPPTAVFSVYPSLLRGADVYDPEAPIQQEVDRLMGLGYEAYQFVERIVGSNVSQQLSRLNIQTMKGAFTLTP